MRSLVHERTWIRLIAGFKFTKALCLAIAAAATWELMNPRFAQFAQHGAAVLVADHRMTWLNVLLIRFLAVDPRTLRLLTLGTLLYAILFAIEGVGLWFERHWAQMLTVVTTAGLVPLEIHHASRHPGPARLAVVAANVAVVVYLVNVLRAQSRRRRAVAPVAAAKRATARR